MRLATTACGYSGRPTCPCTLYRTSQAMPTALAATTAIVYRMAVKLKGSICVSAGAITANRQPHQTVATRQNRTPRK